LVLLFRTFFGERAKEEQSYVVEINHWLMVLEINPTDDPAMWVTEIGIGKSASKRYLCLRSDPMGS